MLAAMQAQVELHDYDSGKDNKKFKKCASLAFFPNTFSELLKFLPPKWVKAKKIADDVLKEYKNLKGSLTELQAKFRYDQIARSLKTYGTSLYECTVDVLFLLRFTLKIQNKPVTVGVRRDAIQLLNADTFVCCNSSVNLTFHRKYLKCTSLYM